MNQLSAGYGAAGLAGYGGQYSMAGLGAGGWYLNIDILILGRYFNFYY